MSNRERPALLTDADLPRLFSIDAGRPFLADLAEGLIDALGPDLQRAEIFLPTRRALRAAGEAVLDACERRGVGAALLPRFRAIGDIEEDELTLFAGEAADEIDALPAISPTARMVTLARFVAMRDCDFAGQANWPAAIAAARELGKLLDSFHTEEADLSALAAIDVAGAADHWKRSLDFLEVVTRVWPDYLRNIGRLDPARRRARLIDATARRIAEHPPAHPVIIAGTPASAPAVARLVAAIARAPCGAAILPGLDRSMDARAWSLIEDAHPQAGLKALLDEMGIAPARVRPWPRSGGDDPRTRLLTLALRPAEATDEWLALVGEMTGSDLGLQTATRGLALIEADHEEAEAAIIAEAQDCLAKNANRIVRYGKDSPYIDIRLPCGSGIDVFFDVTLSDADLEEVLRANGARERAEALLASALKRIERLGEKGSALRALAEMAVRRTV